MRQTTINFLSLRCHFKVTSLNCFNKYLKELFKDLSLRSHTDRLQGITFITFYDYYKIPFVLANKIFETLDKDKDSFLSYEEFNYFFNILLLGDYLTSLRLIFDICDFSKKGYIVKEDIKLLLSYLPVKQQSQSKMEDQEKLFIEIDLLLSVIFGEKRKLSWEEFQYITDSISSNVFLHLLCFMIISLPIKEKNFELFQFFDDNKYNYKSQNFNRRFYEKTLLLTMNSCFKINDYLISLQRAEIIFIQNKFLNRNEDDHDIIRILNKVDDELNLNLDSFPNFLEPHCNNTVKECTSNNWNTAQEDENNYEDQVFKLTKTGRLKRYIMMISGREIFYFKSPLKEILKGMHNLTGAFIKINEDAIVINNSKYYSFKINFCGKDKTFYTESKDAAVNFVQKLKKAIEQKEIENHYDILSQIGHGSFARVFKAMNKQTKEFVAIKVFDKCNLVDRNYKYISLEIEILKNSHHPNVIGFIEKFEDPEFVYIVMEYASGGDLLNFLLRKETITESVACKIIKQLAGGIKYLNNMGIVHRDLKPDNIFITNLDKLEIKIADFGLSKILSKAEQISEAVGSINYAAPEVLLQHPYTPKIDVWSFGIICYQILSKNLPFDDPENIEEKIASEIILEELKFKECIWKSRSNESMNLIKRCLEKDQDRRIDIQNVLNHKWFINTR